MEAYETESFQMLWDPGFDSWTALGVRGQPAFAVFDRDGTFQTGWYGPANADEVLALVREL